MKELLAIVLVTLLGLIGTIIIINQLGWLFTIALWCIIGSMTSYILVIRDHEHE